MLPPPGLEPSLASLLESAIPTASIATSIASATITAAATAAASALSYEDNAHVSSHQGKNGECNVVGPFAIFIQGALGLCALLALVFKRWKERPQRPLKIWFFDVSKQVVGSVLVHIANLLMSMLSSGQFNLKASPATVVAQRNVVSRMVDQDGNYSPNPCSFYLLNLAIDTTIGIPILIFLLRIFTALFALTPVGNPRESIESGNYGSPPKASWWFKQSIIYFIGLMGMKVCVLVIFLVLPWISRVGDWALRWTEGNEVLQVMFVMLVFPVIMNATQYYIIDSFIKKQNPEHEPIPDHEDDRSSFEHPGGYGNPQSGSSDEIHSGDEEDAEVAAKAQESEEAKPEVGIRTKRRSSDSRPGSSKDSPRKASLRSGMRDYDPMFDGDSSPTVVGSASTSERERDRLASKEADSESEEERARLAKK